MGLVDATPALEHTRKERTLAQLGDLELDVARLGRDQARTAAISLGGARQGPFVTLGLDDLGRLGVDQRLIEERDHLANEIAALVALQSAQHLR